MNTPTGLQLQLAAAPCVQDGSGQRHPLQSLDAALLAWLALQGPTPRAQLAQLLWPDSTDQAARNSLRQRLFKLRQQLAGLDLVVGQATLSLNAGVQHDLVGAATVLGHLPPPVDGPFAVWLAQERAQRLQQRRQELVGQAEQAEANQDWTAALGHAQALLALDPQSEDAHRRLMRLHYLAGDRSAALLAFDACERMLKDEVGARPSPQTLALLKTIEAAAPPAANTLPAAGAVPAGVLRPPRLVGREYECAQLLQAWQAGHVAALVGEAGLGKTRLLQHFAAEQGATLYAAGRPGDAGVPFATLARLLRAVSAGPALAAMPPRTRSEIARVLPDVGMGAAPTGGEGQRLPLLRAVLGLLRAHAPQGTVALDDLHFADEASLDLLQGLLDSPQDVVPLRWLLAWRPAEQGSALQRLQDGLAEQARLVPVRLAPLDEAALALLVDSLGLPGVKGSAVAAGLLQRTGGNPLFVLETLKQAWVERTLAHLADAQRMPRPLSVGRLIERRVAQLSPAALALARVASIAGPDFGIELAEAVLQAGALQFADALNELESAQVLRGTAFAHDLVHDAVRASVPKPIAQLTHARVAAWLEQRPAEPARIARHWQEAGRQEQALPWLAQAAQRAGAALRRREQIEFLDSKAAIEEAMGRRGEAFDSLMQAAEVEVTLDDALAAVASRCDRLDALADDATRRVRAATQRSNLAEMQGFHDEAERVAERALREALREGVDAQTVAHCRIALGTALSGQERPGDALVHFEAALEWVRQHADAAMRCEFHGNLAITYDRLCRLEDGAVHHQHCVALARECGDYGNEAVGLSNFGSNRSRAGMLEDADRVLLQARRVYAQAAEPSAIAGYIAIEHTVVHRQLGRYALALRDAEEGLASLEQFAPGYCDVLRAHEAACWAHLGQWARFEQLAEGVDAQRNAPRVALRLALMRRMADQALGRSTDRGELQRLITAADARGALDFQHSKRIESASLREDAAALADLHAVAREAAELGHRMTELLALARGASLAAQLDRHEEALHLARAAWSLRGQVGVVSAYPMDPWAHCARAVERCGEQAMVADLARHARDWIDRVEREHVPAPFRESFRHRNPFNRELLAVAARLGL